MVCANNNYCNYCYDNDNDNGNNNNNNNGITDSNGSNKKDTTISCKIVVINNNNGIIDSNCSWHML